MNSEFINTNQYGGYSSFDLREGNTRKYHGLLVAGGQGFVRRQIVAGLNEYIIVNGESLSFSSNQYRDKQIADSSMHLKSAFYLPYPMQTFRIGAVEIKKSVEFDQLKNEVLVSYTLSSPHEVTLALEPLLNYREIDKLGLGLLPLNASQVTDNNGSQKVIYPDGNLLIVNSDLNYQPHFYISNNHYYPLEEDRGYDSLEDLAMMGKYTINAKPGVNEYYIRFSYRDKPNIRKVFRIDKFISEPITNPSIASDISRFCEVYPDVDKDFAEFLVYNGRQFQVKDDNRFSLIAGYHWFGDWSRDTFISYKGLLLGLGRYHQAQRILNDWSKYLAVGLLPNTMAGLHYNSIDGVLWYIQAVWHYWVHTGDRETVLKLIPKLERIVYALCRGSKYGINVNEKGYLTWDDKTKALTWMDANVNNKPVIDRTGAAIEIQALWYSSLQIVEHLSQQTGYKLVNLALFDQLENLIEQNFSKDFWNEELGYLADVVKTEGMVMELRPNQLAALGMEFPLVSGELAEKTIARVEAELLTPVGMKTLSPSDANYKHTYTGMQEQRDEAYHQGTVWVWPLILYFNAIGKSDLSAEDKRMKIKTQLDKSWEYYKSRQMMTIPEIFSAEDLKPAGAINQAWSVAALIEGVMIMNEIKN